MFSDPTHFPQPCDRDRCKANSVLPATSGRGVFLRSIWFTGLGSGVGLLWATTAFGYCSSSAPSASTPLLDLTQEQEETQSQTPELRPEHRTDTADITIAVAVAPPEEARLPDRAAPREPMQIADAAMLLSSIEERSTSAAGLTRYGVAIAAPDRPADPLQVQFSSQPELEHLSRVAMVPIDHPPAAAPVLAQADLNRTQERLRRLAEIDNFGQVLEGSPAITIVAPPGFGADSWTGFLAISYQSRTRFTRLGDGSIGLGLGLWDAVEAVGVEVSYSTLSFGGSRPFGTGGFNLKIHRALSSDTSVAIGINNIVSTGNVDGGGSVYGSISQIIRTSDRIDDPFSRIALTAGIGGGSFRSESDVLNGRNTIGFFGSLAVRIVRPLSAILEWTGQDLAVGLSIVPIQNVNWTITPAIRDITGAGDGARFVLGTSFSFWF